MRARTHTASAFLMALAATGAPAWGAVTLAPASGHPNLSVTISGSSFGASEAVDVYVDTADTLLLATTATGTFSGALTIPASAQPGKHYVTAIGRNSGTASQMAFQVTTPWTEMGFGAAHLGWNPYENTLNAKNVASLGPLWDYAARGSGATATIGGGRVFVATETGLAAVSAGTGTQQWKAFTNSVFYASPALAGTTLFAGEGTSTTMLALNAATGAQIWATTTGDVFEASPVVAGGIVYAGCLDDNVYAFSAATGQIWWKFATGDFIDSSPAVVGGVVYIGSLDGKVYALNAATGVLIWSFLTGAAVESPPVVLNGVLYVGSDDSKLYALGTKGANAGVVLWSITTGGAIYEAPAAANGVVYAGSADNKVYALDAHSGALLWSHALNGAPSAPAIANGVVYITSHDGSLLALDASSGATLASGLVGYSTLGSPSISDGGLYLNASLSDTYAFSLLSGTNAVRRPAPAGLHKNWGLVVTR